jgi:hypothetical protein
MDFEASYAKSVGEGLYFYTLFFAVGFWGIMDGLGFYLLL